LVLGSFLKISIPVRAIFVLLLNKVEAEVKVKVFS
jgi:hypothetical protein